MEHRDYFILEVIIEYCDQILHSIEGLDLQKFSSDLDIRDACALRVLQIGENASDLSASFREAHPEVDWRAIIGLRNIIAHEYGNVDTEVLWEIVDEDIPVLRKQCTEIIQ